MTAEQIRLLAVFQEDGRLCVRPCSNRLDAATGHQILSEFEMLGARIFLAQDNVVAGLITETQMSKLFVAVQAEIARQAPGVSTKPPQGGGTGNLSRRPGDTDRY